MLFSRQLYSASMLSLYDPSQKNECIVCQVIVVRKIYVQIYLNSVVNLSP
jgi:hypothetical protein